ADSLFEAGDYSGALRQYDVVLLWDPANPHAGQRLAECRYRIEINEGRQSFDENEYVAALYRARLALQIKHGDTEAMALVSKCQLRIEENADRSQMIASVLRSAIDRYADGRYVEAEAGFQEVLRMDPENRLAAEYEYKSRTNVQNAIHRLVLRSRSLAERGQYGSAIASLEEALRLQPNGNIKADLLVLRQRQRDAAASTKASTALRKTRPPSSERTAISKALENRYESGLRHLEKGDFDRAARDLLEVWTVEPRYRNVSDVLTRSYLFMGMKVYSEERYEDAIRIWEKVLAIDPGNAKAQRYLRKTREEAGRLSGGQQ
ncbi:MAG: hypothetical protein IH969_07720, partial [Candidatus Krumholzibacteriota bacterium]|nr:hypothetical protein [Candidatus Krumholzibacteriota bacterium]